MNLEICVPLMVGENNFNAFRAVDLVSEDEAVGAPLMQVKA
jgi:hypothetical protein